MTSLPSSTDAAFVAPSAAVVCAAVSAEASGGEVFCAKAAEVNTDPAPSNASTRSEAIP